MFRNWRNRWATKQMSRDSSLNCSIHFPFYLQTIHGTAFIVICTYPISNLATTTTTKNTGSFATGWGTWLRSNCYVITMYCWCTTVSIKTTTKKRWNKQERYRIKRIELALLACSILFQSDIFHSQLYHYHTYLLAGAKGVLEEVFLASVLRTVKQYNCT